MVAIWRRRRRDEEPALGTGPDETVREAEPDRLTELRPRSWFTVLRSTVKEFKDDELSDRAATLTYYGVLAIFPAPEPVNPDETSGCLVCG